MFTAKAAIRTIGVLLAGAMLLASPAQAQFSDGYKFIEAIKKKEVEKVNAMLGEPGSTIINTRDISTGRGAIHVVTERRDLQWLNFLIGKGANVNLRDNQGVTALVIATGLGWEEGVSQLVANKARLEESNSSGETPLITAVHRRQIPLMRILLKAGADPDRTDNSGRSARAYAALDRQSSTLLAEITASAKPKAAAKAAGKSYGPTF